MEKYKDNRPGVLSFIRKETTLSATSKTECIPDPVVEGVWKVTYLLDIQRNTTHKVHAIIYMAGYKDPFNRVREYNDFEVCDGNT